MDTMRRVPGLGMRSFVSLLLSLHLLGNTNIDIYMQLYAWLDVDMNARLGLITSTPVSCLARAPCIRFDTAFW